MESGFLNKIFLALEGRIPDINKKNISALANSHRNMVNEWEDKIRNINLKSKLIRNDNLRLYQAMVISRDRCLIGYYSLLNSLAQIEFAQHQAGFMVGSLIGGLLIGIAAGWAVGPMLTAVVAMTDNIIILFITELTLNVVTGFLTSLIIGGIGKAAGAIDYDAKHILGDFVGNLVGGVFGFIGSKAIMTILNNNLGTGIIKGAIAKDVAGVTEKTAEEAGGKASSVLSFMKSSGSLIGHTALGSANMFLYNTFNQKIVSGNWVNVSNEDWATDVFYNLVPGLGLGMVSGFHNYKFGDKRDYYTIKEKEPAIQETNNAAPDNNNIESTLTNNNTYMHNTKNNTRNNENFYASASTHYFSYDINNDYTNISSSSSESSGAASLKYFNPNEISKVDDNNHTYNPLDEYNQINKINNNNYHTINSDSIKSSSSESSGAVSPEHLISPKNKLNDKLNDYISTVEEAKEDENIKPYIIGGIEVKDNSTKTHSTTIINNDHNSSLVRNESLSGTIGDANSVVGYDGVYNPNQYFNDQGLYNGLDINNIHGVDNRDPFLNSSIKNSKFITNLINSDTNQLPLPPKVKNDNYVKVDDNNIIINNNSKELPKLPPKILIDNKKVIKSNNHNVSFNNDKEISFNQKNNNQNKINIDNKNIHNIDNNDQQQFLQNLSSSKRVVKENSYISFNDNKNIKQKGYIQSIDYRNLVATIKYVDNSKGYDNLKSINKRFDELKEENKLNNIDIDFNHEEKSFDNKPLPQVPLKNHISNIDTLNNDIKDTQLNKFNIDNTNDIVKSSIVIDRKGKDKANYDNNENNININRNINYSSNKRSSTNIDNDKIRRDNFPIKSNAFYVDNGGKFNLVKIIGHDIKDSTIVNIQLENNKVIGVHYNNLENDTKTHSVINDNNSNISDSSKSQATKDDIILSKSSEGNNNLLTVPNKPFSKRIDIDNYFNNSNKITDNRRKENFTIGDNVTYKVNNRGKTFEGKVVAYPNNVAELSIETQDGSVDNINYGYVENITRKNMSNITVTNYDSIENNLYIKNNTNNIDSNIINNNFNYIREEKFAIGNEVSYLSPRNGLKYKGKVLGFSKDSDENIIVGFGKGFDIHENINYKELHNITKENQYNKQNSNKVFSSNSNNRSNNSSIIKGKTVPNKVSNYMLGDNIDDKIRREKFNENDIISYIFNGKLFRGYVTGYSDKSLSHVSVNLFDESSDNLFKMDVHHAQLTKIIEPSNDKEINKTGFNINLTSNNTNVHNLATDNNIIDTQRDNNSQYINTRVSYTLTNGERKEGTIIGFTKEKAHISRVRIDGYTKASLININKLKILDNKNDTLISHDIDHNFKLDVDNNDKLIKNNNADSNIFIADSVNIELNDQTRRTNFKEGDNVSYFDGDKIINGKIAGYSNDDYKCNLNVELRDNNNFTSTKEIDYRLVNKLKNDTSLSDQLFKEDDNVVFHNKHYGTVNGTVKSKVDNKLICEFVGRNNTKIKEIDINDKDLQHDNNIKINNKLQNSYDNNQSLKPNIKNNDLDNRNIDNYNINSNSNKNNDFVIKNGLGKSKGIFNKFKRQSINIFNNKNNKSKASISLTNLNNISTDSLVKYIEFEYPNGTSIIYKEGNTINFANPKNSSEIVEGILSGIAYGKEEDIAWIKYFNNETKKEDSITIAFNDLHVYNQD